MLIKYFFIINVPINYPPLSKKSLNLSKSCPTEPKKIRKIPKNSEKSRFFSFFTYGLIALFAKSRVTIYHTRSWKKSLKKKSKKKWFSFLQTFFLKSILDIFLCPISKLKKKFWKVEDFPFFRRFKNYCLSPIFPIAQVECTEFAFLLEHLISIVGEMERNGFAWSFDSWTFSFRFFFNFH